MISIHHINLPDKINFKRKIYSLIKLIAIDYNKTINFLNIIICSDDYLLTLNKQYLKHNTLTDVITFQYNTISEKIEADIYISFDRVRENAELYEEEYKIELLRVIIHGVLHLMGLKDKKKEQKAIMRQQEYYYIKKFREQD